MGKSTRSASERFWEKVEVRGPDDCWEWRAARNSKGYGNFWFENQYQNASNASYRLVKGPVARGMEVRHTCDNPPCVNPAHLLIGTSADNKQDSIARGRFRTGTTTGEDHWNHKLTAVQVAEIREAYRPFVVTQRMLAERYGVTKSAVKHVLRGRSWAT